MATNNFKPFATGAGANVMSQADWEALTALLTGFQSGKAASAQVNKALRQGTVMASVIGQFIADSTGQDVLDNGNTSVLLTNFLNALKANTNGRLLNVRTFTASGTYTPTTGTKKIRVRLVGGGGAGGGAAASTSPGTLAAGHGGSAGTYGETGLIDVSSVSSVVVTVGSAGTSSAGGNGTSGGASSFGSYISAPGGAGGNYGASGTATFSLVPDLNQTGGCSGSSVLLNVPGEGGWGQMSFATGTAGGTTTTSSAKGGRGGNSVLGGGGYALINNSVPGSGTGYGAGGAGAATTFVNGTSAAPGGAGSSGIVIIEEYA
ncbi:Tail fiber protein [Enterobacter kobei]|uniref:glycine-rich domain-containing protein n=1 Tax=Enterobacter TaxID=547 RepID=UPI0003BEE6E0|nr:MULTISPECIES: hypothetical protein [Enterobacter]MCE1373715.1 hypothetical protein [Enterobacter hormaechei]ESN26442.1 hypothetical protein L369_01836 [Enterobacter sp. MGH 23]MBD3602131.1 hypothetical protein [Enterobacter kobei]MCK6722957.1 hypothetical protein [Enterobacter kobei]MCK6796428.1 hypothetical protein [Enterobacter kobei]